MGDNDMVEAVGKGSILVETRVKGSARSIRKHDVLHMPDLHANLISVSKLTSRGLKVHLNSLGCMVRASNDKMLAVASLESNLYQLETKVMHGAKTSYLAHSEANSHHLEFWHKRFGHLNANSVKSLKTMVSGMHVQTVPNNVHSFTCEGYVHGKQGRRPFLSPKSLHPSLPSLARMEKIIMTCRDFSFCDTQCMIPIYRWNIHKLTNPILCRFNFLRLG